MPMSDDNIKIRLAFVGNPVINTAAPARIEGDVSSLKIRYDDQVILDRDNSQIKVIVTMTYLLGNTILFSGSLTIAFDVVDLRSYITLQDGEDRFRIESNFLPMLNGIAFSTARGYFARELADTALAPYPFPIIASDSIEKRTSYQLI